MRIISQIKEDIPYEHVVVFVDDNFVKWRPIPDIDKKSYALGEYVDNERALEVFSEIHNHFENYAGDVYPLTVFIMPEE